MADPEPEPIAIIGMGCRLPGNVGSPEDLWRLLSKGGSGWSLVPADRWNVDSFYHPDATSIQAYNTKSGYFLSQNVADFDSRFFGFGSHEADVTDPQQRILLETTYEALENAGIPIESIKGSDTAVFAALFARDYDRMGYKNLETLSKFHIGGTGEAIIANRISHFFDLRGISMTIDTGCSGSLVALHEACISLRTGQSRMAIVGGTEILLHPDQNVSMSSGGMLNSEGKCFTFDSRGAGYGRGEGVATVVVKRLKDALQDGDTVHAVIRNSGANQDGKTLGVTLPNPDAQEALIRSVYAAAHLDPHETLYVEAHGTGTEVGDKAEIQSLGNVFGENPRVQNLYVGSVKTNIGHLEAASGLAGLIKAVLVLKKQQIPPNLNYIKPKPGLRLDERQISVPLELVPLVPEGNTGAVRVSLNSFGYGGTNCHLILESLEQSTSAKGLPSTNGTASVDGAVSHTHGYHGTNGIKTSNNGTNGTNGTHGHVAPATTGMPLVFPLSASSEAALDAMLGQLKKWLAGRDTSDSDLRDLSYTLACRRSLFKWRKAYVASNLAQLTSALNESKVSKTRAAPSAKIAFVFTGQGAQWAGMGAELIASSQTFKNSIDESSRVLEDLGCEWDLVQELTRPDAESRINESELAQPTTTIVQMALVDMLADLGVRPKFVVGHSSGEIAAAYAVGALAREGAIMSSFSRGRYSAVAKKLNTLPGSMLAAGYGEQAALQTIKAANLDSDKGRITVACINSPASTTLSGDEPAIDYIQNMLITGGVFARKLKVETAYHSHHMEKVAGSYLQSIRELPNFEAQEDIEFFSSVTGVIKTSGFGPEYWVENLVSQVRFNDAMTDLLHSMAATGSQDAANILIEIGPHSALQGPINQILSTISGFKSSYLAPLSRSKNSADSFSAATARLFELGAQVNFQSLFTKPGHVLDDLIPYPWDHRVKHWAESRLSRDHRLRPFPYHDLLGVYDVMSPIDEPRWRHHLSVQRLPWLKDHVVDGMVIFPGAGYSTMGVEAMKQLVQMQMQNPGSEVKIAKTIMRDISIARPIILPVESTDGPGEDIEVQLILSPSKLSKNSPWYSVRILSLQADKTWAEHVSGTIRVELEAATKPEDASVFGEEHKASIDEAFEALERIQSLAQEKMDMATFYDDRRAAGNDWGPSFALLSEAYIGPGVGFSKLHIPNMAQWMPFGYFQPHLIHPTTLDASNHMLPAIFHREIVNAPLMPVTTEESVFFSHLSSNPGDEMVVAMELKAEGKSAGRGNVWAFQHNPTTGKLVLVSSVRGLLMRAVGEGTSTTSPRPFSRKHNYQVHWNDDPDLLTESSFARLVQPHVAKGSAFLEKLSITEKATTIYLYNVKDLSMIQDPSTAPLPHLREFSRWIANYVTSPSCLDVYKSLPADERPKILTQSDRSGIEGEMLGRIGRNLAAILTNTVNPLEILVADNLLERFYKEGPFKPLYDQMVQYMGLLTHKNPHMKVLEIGAGTGSATLPLFVAMGDDAPDLIEGYTYTDISSGFFETARDRLEKWKAVVEYKTLDISRDFVGQGFEGGSYDLIVASNVLHATRSMRETMENVRGLLKPGGRLLLVEVNKSTGSVSRILGTIFGTLSGWWEFEDGRRDSPLLTNGEWDGLLLGSGFEGVEFVSPDCDGPLARTSFIVAKAVEVRKTTEMVRSVDSVSVVFNPASPVGKSAGGALSFAFQERGLLSVGYSWDALPSVEQDAANGTMYVVLDSANSTVLENPSAEMFARFQNLLVNCRNVLWITFQEEGGSEIAPIKALVSGLARVVRRENEGVKFITVEVRDSIRSGDDVDNLVKEALRVSQLLLSTEVEHRATDDEEFVLSGDRFLIPRVYADKQFNQWTDLVNGRGHLSPQLFKNPKLPLRMEMGAPGLLSSIHFVQDTVPSSPLGCEEIQIDSKAFGINFRDVFVALGQLSLATFMGECAGVVTAVGSGEFLQRTYKVGDRVVGMHAQPFASYGRLSGYEAHVLPDNISFAEAASIQVVFTTVYYSLVNVARLEPGQTVLIHAGSGGVGQAAIQLAKHLGAEVFVTVGSEEKKQFLITDYGIPESHILSSRATPSDFRRHLMRLTGNRGVDIVLNSMSGEMLAESWDCVASFGYHIELGKSDIDKNRYISMAPFKRNLTFASVDLVVISQERPKVFYQVLDNVIALFSDGVLKPVHPLNVFPIDRLESAFRLISERKHLGKVVLDFEEDTMVQAALPSPPSVQLRSDGTYVIAGGLGDIGRMLVKHLAARGAGHIVTLSRRKLSDEERVAWEAEVEKLGAKLHVLQCDITDAQSVQKTAEYCKQSLPPVRGLFHAGMVLKDRPLVKMTPEEWNSVLGPKVFGTWNLDRAFSSPNLDFFVALASLAGTLGNPGQSNYSAANAFQDYFVTHHDRTNPTRYVSVDLPLVDETSAIMAMKSENRDFVGKGSILFDVGELLQLMDFAMDSSIKLTRPFFHALMGFDRQSMKINSGDYVWASMFRTIPRMQTSDSNDYGNSGVKRDIEGLLRSATSFEEAVKVITETTIEKFIAFLNLEADDVGPHQALSSFGLDSLVSIELKNWMVRTFKVSLQSSELTSAPSFTHLAETLASRSKIFPATLTKQAQNQESSRDEPAESNGDTAVSHTNGTNETDIEGLECCALPPNEARQPVPDLDEAMQNHIDNIAHFALSDDEVETLRTAVRDFNAPNSTGQQVYKAIQKDALDPKVDNWVSRHVAEDFHLHMRQALQYTNFMAINHPSPVPHTQAERAALLAVTAFQLKKDIDNGKVEALFIMDTPVCQAPLKWLFNTYRRPQVGMDKLKKGAGDYCVVFRRGRVFRVALQDGEVPASFDTLRSAMTAILDYVQDEGTWAGILTSDNRDSWARIRNDLLEASPTNAHYFQTIESAVFAINLDDNTPTTYSDQAKQSKLGNGFNRWNDKPLQFIITANGNSSVIVEHSHLDGTTPVPLYDRMRDAIASYKPTPPSPPNSTPPPREVPLTLPPTLTTHIITLRDRYHEASASRDFISYNLPTLGAHLLAENKVPIKSGYDLLCQLALYLYYNHRVIPNWQPVMLAHFHAGRHDMVQLASAPVRAFCEATAGNERNTLSVHEKRTLMLEAARDISRRVTEAKNGKGFFRLFTVMEQKWPAGVPKAGVFDDTLLKRGMDFTAVTNINHASVESVTTPLDPSVLRVRYTIRDASTLISLNCPVGAAEKLVQSVNEAAGIIRELSLAR